MPILAGGTVSMESFSLSAHPHRRLNILTGEWVLVSPHRAERPWQGKVEHLGEDQRKSYDPDCYLCPGNRRANDEKNPEYKSTFVFTNDFSALIPTIPDGESSLQGLLVAESEPGICRVVCFSPRHDLSLAEMELGDIRIVIDVWAREYDELGARPDINHIQVFENKGELMGCSNPHPHGQIWAQRSIPTEPAKEIARMEEHLRTHGSCLLCDYLALEMEEKERIVYASDAFVVMVPFWAVWPFETIIMPRRHVSCISELTDAERDAFAEAIKRLTTRYDNLFRTSFPYSSGLHQSPTDGRAHPEYHMHMHFYPPLLRSASVKKFMVGYEMLANPQRDITPESSAQRLRQLPDIHYGSTLDPPWRFEK
jgi:UDPglucose--hexose-1-phosphate uridylyltransferase